MDKSFLRATQTSKAVAPSLLDASTELKMGTGSEQQTQFPLADLRGREVPVPFFNAQSTGHFAWVNRRGTNCRIPMTESSKPLMDASESEKDRLRQKLLRLIVQRESRRCQPSPPQPQLKR